ncbi:terminase small subunit [Fibrella sp. ES10-3-2-2]|nr:hypothetical protein A6C57_00245 [Fibrella sp. ES10-3-2-2]
MTKQQERFVDAYVLCLNGKKAAERAGYSKVSAKQSAHRLLNQADIREAINARLNQMQMPWEEAARHIANTAATRLNDFMIEETVIESHMTRKPLQDLIDALELEYKIEQEFFDESGMGKLSINLKNRGKRKGDNEDDGEIDKRLLKKQDDYFFEQQERKATITRYKIELRYNPAAYRDVPESRPVVRVMPDLKALKDAEETGAIKKLSFDKRGLPTVELYPADRMWEIILKMKGKLVERHDHTSDGLNFMDLLKEVSRDEH